MLARVAETLYRTARDLERAENLARLLEASQAAALEGDASNGAGGRLVWEPLVHVAGDMDDFLLTHRRADERSVPWFVSFGRDNPDSIASCLTRARESARSVRDRLPTEVWEGINDAWLELVELAAGEDHARRRLPLLPRHPALRLPDPRAGGAVDAP